MSLNNDEHAKQADMTYLHEIRFCECCKIMI